MKEKSEKPQVEPYICQIKASAGSGKTHALTEQYLQHLCDSSSINTGSSFRKAPCASDWASRPASFGDIVAITFTNAAVTELRDRVLASLKKIALGLEQHKNISKELAEKCLETLLDDMGQMNVRTIDSLLYQIVRSAAPGLGLAPDFQPAFSFGEAMASILEEFLLMAETGSEEHRQLLGEVMDCFLEASKNEDGRKYFFFNKPLAERLDTWFPFTLSGNAQDLQNIPDAAVAREEFVAAGNEIVRLAKKILAMVETINGQLAPKNSLKLNKRASDALGALALGDVSNKKLDSSYLNQDSIRDIFNQKDRISSDLADLDVEYAAIKNAVKKWRVRQQYLKNAALVELSVKLAKIFWERLGEQKLLPSDLMSKLAGEALDFEGFGVCDTLCRLGSRLTHFLIDEFQDTSQKQWDGLKPLVVEAISRGGSFTWVGDIKQSIFMWRGASPQLFDAILKDREFTDIVPHPRKETLRFNRRSAREIVNHNNRMFKNLQDRAYARLILEKWLPENFSGKEEAADRVAQAFLDSEQEMLPDIDTGGYVDVVVLESEDGAFLEQFSEDLINFLDRRVGRGISYRDVLVLVRSGKDATFIAEQLAANSKNVISENSLLLASQPLVEQSRAFLEFLDNPANDVAFMTILEGSIFAKHPVAANLPCWDDFAAARQGAPLYRHFREQFPEIWRKVFQPFYVQSTKFAPYDAIKEWYRRMGAEERFPQEQIFLRSFLEQLYAAETQGIHSIPEFLEYWKANGDTLMATMPEGIDAVRIMTIHKAKGLAAPIVFVPLPRSALEISGRRVKGFASVTDGDQKYFVGIDAKTTPREYREEYIRQVVEALDLLYVAFTRPRKELYIYMQPGRSGKNLVSILGEKAHISWPCGQLPILEAPVDKVEEEEFIIDAPPLPEKESALPWLDRLKIVPTELFSGSEASRRGTFLHFCLENIRFTGDPEIDAENAFRFGLAHAPFPVNEEKLASLLPAIKWLLGFEQMRDWLARGWPEQPLLDAGGSPLRADLLVRLPECTLIIDYKTGDISTGQSLEDDFGLNEAHIRQIRSYMACVEQDESEKKPVLGLLVYMDKRKFLLVEKKVTGVLNSACPLAMDGKIL